MTLPSTHAITLPREQVTYPKAQGYGALVEDLWVRLAPDREQAVVIGTRDVQAQRSDDSGSIYENILDLGWAWARTNYSGGEGLDWDPRQLTLLQGEQAFDQIRYWDSANLDVGAAEPGIPYRLGLSRIVEEWGGTSTAPKDISASPDFIYIADGQIVSWYPDWNTFTATGTDDVGVVVAAMASSPNDNVMVVGTDGDLYYKQSGLGTFTKIYDPSVSADPDVLGVWYAKGRWIISQGDGIISILSEVSAPVDGITPVTPSTFDTAEGVFWSVVDSGPAIVAACDDGTARSYTPFLQSDDPAAVGQLIPRGRTDMPEGEYPYLLGDVAGALVILTIETDEAGTETVRAYQAAVLDSRFDFTVGQLQLKRTWDETGEAADVTRNMITLRDELFWTILEGDGNEWLWRFDAVTNGLSRQSELGTVALFGATAFEGIFGARSATTVYLLNSSLTYQALGYMISPNITFGVDTDIAWLATVVEASNIKLGGKVELYRTTVPEAINDPFDPSWTLVRRLSNDLQSGVEVPLINVVSRTLALQLRVTPNSDEDESPQITRVAIRGINTKRDWIVELPINISDNIEVPGRRPVRIPNYGDAVHNELMTKVGRSIEMRVVDPPLVFRGIVDNLLEPTTWISPRGSSGRRCTLIFRGDRVTASEVPTGDAGLGLGLLGVTILGVGQTGGL